ncbi:MAG: DUF4345 domain-containing protein [Actinomycetota bacterium]|nr:DUF4345 domain-containing protein [Actinomycetota bacterium]
MAPGASRRWFETLLRFLGLVAFVAGAATAVLGVTSVVGAEEVSGTVDSEMRFYAVWYAGAGLLLLRSARRIEAETTMIRWIAGALFVAGCARAPSWIFVGEPHVVAKALMIAELVLPFVIVPWHAALVRDPAGPTRTS